MSETKLVTFSKHLWIIGFGSIARGTIPLLFKNIGITKEQITVVAKDLDLSGVAAEYDLTFKQIELGKENYKEVLDLQEGDFVLNLSIDVSCIDIMQWATDRNALYLDTSCEPWAGGYFDKNMTTSERSMYCSRMEALQVRDYQKKVGKFPTVITSHGANPGIVSHFVKQALLNIAKDTGVEVPVVPKTKSEWAALSQELGVKVIHIAERDTQIASKPRPIGQIQSTWSVEGYYSESIQPSELCFGSHEKQFPKDGCRHEFGDSGIYLDIHSHQVRVRSWTPTHGPYQGYLIPHQESMTIGEFLQVRNEKGELVYRPTVHFSYRPCDAAVLSMDEVCGKNYNYESFSLKLLSYDDIIDGMDELGVLVAGHKKNAYWFGSQLTIHEAKKISPYNTATTLQVVSGVIGGMVYAIENPNMGYLECEELDHVRVMEVITPFLGKTGGYYTEWNPLEDRGRYFEDNNLDSSDPWQFTNVRYSTKN
jgi:homospermidine synthase